MDSSIYQVFLDSVDLMFHGLQAPGTFVAAAARNPVCNLSLMVGTTDIPEWCFVEIYGKEGKNCFSEYPSFDDLCQFHQKSPISHISKVCRFCILNLLQNLCLRKKV